MDTNLDYLLKFQDDFFQLRHHLFGLSRKPLSQKSFDHKLALSLKKNHTSKSLQVPTYELSESTKFQEHFKTLKPAILKGAAKNWQCIKKWSPQYLKQNYGETEVPLLNPDMKNLTNLNHKQESTTLSDIIDCFLSGDTSKYARFNNLLHIHPELIEDIDKNWFKKKRGFFGLGEYYSLFIGAKGTKTNLHGACSHNLFCQVHGKKHWTIISPEFDPIIKPEVTRTPYFVSNLNPDNPDLEIYPNFPLITKYECILEEGDILFNPSSWWHQVKNLTPSIGFGFRWLNIVDCFKISPIQTTQFILSTNPTLWTYLTKGKNFSKVIKKSKGRS